MQHVVDGVAADDDDAAADGDADWEAGYSVMWPEFHADYERLALEMALVVDYQEVKGHRQFALV